MNKSVMLQTYFIAITHILYKKLLLHVDEFRDVDLEFEGYPRTWKLSWVQIFAAMCPPGPIPAGRCLSDLDAPYFFYF